MKQPAEWRPAYFRHVESAERSAARADDGHDIISRSVGPAGQPSHRITAAMLAPRRSCSAVVVVVHVLKGNWDWDRKRRPARKWKNRQLGQRIKWSGPSTPQALGMPLLSVPPTQAEEDEHRRAWEAAYWKYREEQLRKLPLLAQECGVDTRDDGWPIRLLLFLAEKEAPGFGINWGRRPGPKPEWNDSTYTELRADIEAEKRKLKERGLQATDKAACRILVSTPKYASRYGEYNRGRSEEGKDKGARLLHNRLVLARKSTGLAAKLLKLKSSPYMTDSLISIYALDPNARAAAEERITARYASYADRVAASGTSSRSTRRK
jgi:hypothetical protein